MVEAVAAGCCSGGLFLGLETEPGGGGRCAPREGHAGAPRAPPGAFFPESWVESGPLP